MKTVKMNIDQILKLTHRLDFFEMMTEHERFEVIQHLEANIFMYPKGTTIIQEGGTSHHLYIVLSGMVTVQKGETTHKALNVIKPGDFFGEIAFMTKQGSNVSIVANEDTIVMMLNNSELDALNGLIRDKIKDKIIFKLIKRLNHMNSLILKSE